jgi:hypothetical protein
MIIKITLAKRYHSSKGKFREVEKYIAWLCNTAIML